MLDGEFKRNPKWYPTANPALSVWIILGHVFWELVIPQAALKQSPGGSRSRK